MNHTPAPWKDVDNGICTHPIIYAPRFGVRRIIGHDDYAHAVHCVNHFADLIDFCTRLKAEYEGFMESASGYPDELMDMIRDELPRLIAKAKGI